MRGPRFVVWIMTAACNLSCRHCYTWRFRGLRELSLEEKLRLARELAELGVEHVNITGGEPTIHPHFPEVFRELVDRGVGVSLSTNATVLRRGVLEMLSKAGSYVYVSLDGPREVHEWLRGHGTFDRVMQGVRELRSWGIPFTVVMAVSRVNYRYPGRVMEIASSVGAEEMAMIPVMPVGRARETGVYVEPGQYLEAIRIAEAKAEELGYPLSLWCTPFAPLVTRSRYVRHSFCRSLDIADIDPSGRLLLCDVTDVVVASVRDAGSFAEAWRRYVSSPVVNSVVSPSRLPEACETCPLRNACRGGCFARALALRGGLNAGDPLCPRIAGLLGAGAEKAFRNPSSPAPL